MIKRGLLVMEEVKKLQLSADLKLLPDPSIFYIQSSHEVLIKSSQNCVHMVCRWHWNALLFFL